MNEIIHYFRDLKIEDVPSTVTQLSYEAHLQDTDLLEVEASDSLLDSKSDISDLFTIDKEKKLLRFANIEARSHCTAIHLQRMYAASSPSWDAEMLFDEIYKIWVKDHQRGKSVAGRFLGLLSLDNNVFELAQDAIKGKNSHRVYVVLSCLGNCFSYLQYVPLQSLVDVTHTQYTIESRDQLVPAFYKELGGYLSSKLHVARRLYELVNSNFLEAFIGLYTSSIEAFAIAGKTPDAISLVLADTKSESLIVKRASLSTLGQLIRFWENNSKLKIDIQKLLIHLADQSEEEISRLALSVLAHAASSQPELIPEIVQRSTGSNPAALRILNEFFWMNVDILKGRSDFEKVLAPLSFLEADNVGHLDYSLSKLIENKTCCAVILEWLTRWAIHNCKTLDTEDKLSRNFQQLITELHNHNKLYELLTAWALSDERELGIAFSDVISELWIRGIKQPIFYKKTIDLLDQEDFKYLARRLLGWVHHGEALLSLTFSMLDTQDAKKRSFHWVNQLLTNEIGRNYPGETLQKIDVKLTTSSGDKAKLLKSAHIKLSKYVQALDNLPNLNELRPPAILQRHVAVKQRKQQREGQESVQRNSIIQQLCTQVPLKAGRGWFSIRDGKLGDTGHLSTHSIEATLPVGAVIDPVNDTITRLGYRVAKRGDE